MADQGEKASNGDGFVAIPNHLKIYRVLIEKVGEK